MKSLTKLFISLILFFASLKVSAAACCGGGFATPALITGDDKAQLTTTYSNSRIDTDVYSNGIWQKRSGDDISQVYKIEGAHIFKDLYQFGFSLPVQTRERSGNLGGTSTGLGDVALQAGYEFLPDWDYSAWRPKGVGFLTLTLPTGKSVYESEDALGLDSRGRGFLALGIGSTFVKTFSKWDANSTLEIHRSFEKTVHNSQVDGKVKPGTGGSLAVGSGYSIKDLRLGASVAWNYEDAIQVENSSGASAQRFATGSLLASYVFQDNWAGTFSYADQTLFGSPSNTTLSKTFSISIQKRWAR